MQLLAAPVPLQLPATGDIPEGVAVAETKLVSVMFAETVMAPAANVLPRNQLFPVEVANPSATVTTLIAP